MKILLLNDDYPPRGKSSVSSIVNNLQLEYAKRGHDTFIITSHRKADSPDIERNGNVVSLPISYRSSLRHFKCLHMKNVSGALTKEMDRIQPDVVHIHNIHAYLTYDALRIARKITPKVFITMHDVMSFSFSRLCTDPYLKSKGEHTRLTPIDHIRQVGMQYNPLRNQKIRKALNQNTKSVIAVSKALKDAMVENGIGNVDVVHNGIDTESWKCDPKKIASFRDKFDLEGRKVILFGGRLSVDKGAHVLLQALEEVRKKIPDVLLLVIGEKKKWESLVRSMNISEDMSAHYRCTGWLEREDVACANCVADVATTPSLCLDAFNTMNVEAVATGTPVVASIFGGASEIIEHEKNGLIVDPQDIEIYAQSLIQILENKDLALSMGKAGKSHIEERFSLQKQIDEYLTLFSS
jgi:glycosyltransferase involved in cell wall biosynthesis